MAVDFRIISIGTLSHNRLWGESAAVRTAHATTALVMADDRRICVDPSLPAQILCSRFSERTGQSHESVTDVFCTTLRPIHRRGIEAFAHAAWWASQEELETYGSHLAELLDSAERLDGDDAEAVRADLELLSRFRPAPEKFAPQVDLYPLPGASPGAAGLLLTPPTATIAIAGDAVVTADHFRAGQVWRGCHDTQAATQSLQDLIELPDIIVPGHDNVLYRPQRWL